MDTEAIQQLNRARRQLGLERVAPTTPEELNEAIDSTQSHLESLKVPDESADQHAPTKKKKSTKKAAPDDSTNRQETGGHTREDG